MKKFFSLAAMALFVSMTAFAQGGDIKTSSSKDMKTTVTDEGMAFHYSRFFFGYAPTSFSFDYKDVENKTMHGFNTGWIGGWNVTGRRLPIYVESGITFNACFGEGITDSDKLMSLEIPINATYRWNIPNTRIFIAPYFGFHFKVNVAWLDEEDDSVFDTNYGYRINGTFYETMDDDDAKRFQFGMETGVNFDLAHFTMGIGYNYDFMPIHKVLGDYNVTTGGFRFKLGFVF